MVDQAPVAPKFGTGATPTRTPLGMQSQGLGQPPTLPNEDIATHGGVQTIYRTPWNNAPYMPGSELDPGGGTPDQVVTLQNQLIQAGLLSPKAARAGMWDAKSQDAYKVVLAFANQHGMNAKDALNVFLANPVNQVKGKQTPFQAKNPLDVAAEVSGGGPGQTNTAQALTGQNLSPSETKDFTAWYAQQEATARDAYKKADLTAGGVATDAPSVTAAAQQYIKEHNLADVTAYGTASRMLQFFDLLKTPGG